ncbi:MAG: sn-glycerol-3-phosphate ABC transporter ATP-binding protein UgpC [Alphaproteobacteria bacterium]|nr:sn-glycerol-3-phosphate ABC transporter ATP-binding protein UgpC [Alphaproteobacteria bacterium]
MLGITLKNAIKRYDKQQVIHGVNLEIKAGEFCVFVGPSGCGKSTLLRMIAGLEETSDGQIFIGTRDVTNIDASERGVAMVFQTYALYPHMNVAENMGFGLKMTGVDKAIIKEKVDKVADTLKLQPYIDRKPKALSGGQRQRVAIGRALVRNPHVFLFDEPLSNLDAELRVEMRIEIARLHQKIGTTMIYVTHDQVEAMTLADKIVVLRAGMIEQIGTPIELYNNPCNKFVAGFIGSPAMNFVSGTITASKLTMPMLSDKAYKIGANANGDANGEVTVGIRPEHISIDGTNNAKINAKINAKMNDGGSDFTIEIVEQLGGVSFIHAIAENGEKLIIEARGESNLKPKDKCSVTLDDSKLYLFDAKTEARIV